MIGWNYAEIGQTIQLRMAPVSHSAGLFVITVVVTLLDQGKFRKSEWSFCAALISVLLDVAEAEVEVRVKIL